MSWCICDLNFLRNFSHRSSSLCIIKLFIRLSLKKIYLSEQVLHNFLKTYYNKRSSHKNKFNLELLTASFSGQWASMKIELPKESWWNSLLAVIKKREISKPQSSSMLMWTTKCYFQWILYFLILGKLVQLCAVGN